MEIENLKEKVAKAQEKVEKCKKTIERHEKAKQKGLDKLAKLGITPENMEEKKWLGGVVGTGASQYYWDICKVDMKDDDIKGATKKLHEAEHVLSNWQVKLELEIEKERFLNDNTPQVIKDFLGFWKKMNYKWYIKRYDNYIALKEKLEAERRKETISYTERAEEYITKKELYKKSNLEWNVEEANYDYNPKREKHLETLGLDKKTIAKKTHELTDVLIRKMDDYSDDEQKRLEILDHELERDKKAKLIDLIQRVNSVVGRITDASNLSISPQGNLDGYIIGTKGKAKVETIGAGGYNIQCFHYRVLVHEIE